LAQINMITGLASWVCIMGQLERQILIIARLYYKEAMKSLKR